VSGTQRLQSADRLNVPIKKEFAVTTSNADFERADEDMEEASSYEEYESPVEEGGDDDSDDDVGSFY
jgi:hypothetical protein